MRAHHASTKPAPKDHTFRDPQKRWVPRPAPGPWSPFPGTWALQWLAILFLLPGSLLHADLKRALAEPNLEKRSGLALDNAAAALKTARGAYDNGDNDQVAKVAAEIQESVELAYKSLVESGKNPRKSDWFKKAEIATRDLDRKIQAFQDSMSFSERPMLDKVKEAIEKVHEDILMGVMEGKKKK